MSSLDFQVKAINNTLSKLPKQMKKTKRKTELAAGRVMIKAIRAKTPKRSGVLRKSVGRITNLKRAVYTYIGIRAGKKQRNDGWYARFVEYGTVKQPARPFFKAAASSGVSAAKSILENGVKLGLNEFKIRNTK